jgi:hypothetical protein
MPGPRRSRKEESTEEALMLDEVQHALARMGIENELVTHRERHREPTDLIFQTPRSRLEVCVHPRVWDLSETLPS